VPPLGKRTHFIVDPAALESIRSVALERIAELEAELEQLRAELAAIDQAQSGVSGAANVRADPRARTHARG
jgi:uncharacterized small protein (DUF1192 family)